MPWKNPEGTVQYHDPEWPADSYWLFKDHETQRDKDAQTKRISVADNFEWDPTEERKARRRGKQYMPAIKAETKMSAVMALLIQQSRGWYGEEFRLPVWWKIPGTDTIHPLAGQIPPCTEEFILERDPQEIRRIENFLKDIYEPLDEDEVESFRQQPEGVARPEAAGQPEGGVPVSNGADGLPFTERPALVS